MFHYSQKETTIYSERLQLSTPYIKDDISAHDLMFNELFTQDAVMKIVYINSKAID